MVALSNIRNRLRAVGNIKQITTSMEMVASARLRKAQIKAKQAQFYIAKTQEILDKLEAASTDVRHPLFEQRKAKKIALVIVCSDRGLCGSYNTRLFSKAEEFLKGKNAEIILAGRKALPYFRRKPWKVRRTVEGWSGKMTFEQIREFTEKLIDDFLSKEVDEIWLLYTQFHLLMDREVVVEKFLPLGKRKNEKKTSSINYIFEPNLEEIYAQLLRRFCVTKIESVFDQAYASELAARIFSMKAASSNAEEMIETLTLERNKVRQAQITREILETLGSSSG